MANQKEYHDKYTIRSQALLEHLSISRPQLLRSLEEHKQFYLFCRIVYAVEDSISFLFGNEKLAFSLIASYNQRSDSGASKELHAFEMTLPGILVTALLGFTLILIQVLGAYFLDSEDLNSNRYKYFFAKVLAPYLRDVLQGIKWAYKGMRSVLNLVFYFMLTHKELILKILFPLSIAIAAVSLINRIFLRTLRNARKKMQSDNRKLSVELHEAACSIKFRKEIPTDEKGLAKLENSYVYILDGDPNSCKIYYVEKDENDTLVALETDLEEAKKQEINQCLQTLQSENICRRIKPELIDNEHQDLVFLDKISHPTSEHAGKLVYLTNSHIEDKERLYKISANGEASIDIRSEYLASLIKSEINDKTALNLHPFQADELVSIIEPHTTPCTTQAIIDPKKWESIKTKKSELFNKHAKGLPSYSILRYTSVGLSALIDSSYFYIGPLFLAALNPAAFMATLAISGIMIAVCLIARVYEEFNYQKVFNISKIEVDLNLLKTESTLLVKKIQANILKYNNQNTIRDLVELEKILKNYEVKQLELQKETRISRTEAFLKGLRNGLSTQGVISGIMFLCATVMLLLGTPCPPAFLVSMLAVSLLAMTMSVARYMRSYNEYISKSKPFTKIDFDKVNKNDLLQNLKELQLIQFDLDTRVICKAPNLFEEEYDEAFGRLPTSAFTKAQKNFGEFTLGGSRHDESWWMLLISLVFSGAMTAVFIFRGIYKMFSAPDENPNVVTNHGLKPTRKRLSIFTIGPHNCDGRGSPTKDCHPKSEPTINFMGGSKDLTPVVGTKS